MMNLSDREMTIAARYGDGETNTQIATGLGIAPATVRNHLAAIYRKLGVSNKAQLIRALSGRASSFGVLPAPLSPAKSAPVLSILDTLAEVPVPEASIAIMPLRNLGPEDYDYVAFGISADLQHALTQCHDLFVSGRASCLKQFAEHADATSAAREIGVKYVLEGTIRAHGDQIRMISKLIDVKTGIVRWSERYDSQKTEIPGIEDDIVRAIAASLALEIQTFQHRKRRHLGVEELTAYDWRLRGSQALELGGRRNLEIARSCFERALEVEPDSAAALAGLSMCYGYECDLLLTENYDACLERHRDLAEKAVKVDETDSRGHYALSCALLLGGEFDTADLHAARGLELNPSEYHTICNRGYSLMALGRPDESLACFAQSLRRNLLAPNSCLLAVGLMEYFAENYGQACTSLSRLTAYEVQRASTIAAACAQVGFQQTSQSAVAEFQKLSREIPIRPRGGPGPEWQQFWSRVYPYLKGDPFEHMLEGIRKASLPV